MFVSSGSLSTKSLNILSHNKFLEKSFTYHKKQRPTRVACAKLPSGPDDKIQRHYVLVHGACHGAWCWYKVSALLKSAGHNVSALDLAASGVHPKQVHEVHSLPEYYEPLMECISSLPSDDRVILVGHSMAGIFITVAMETFPEKISAAVLFAAVMPGPELGFKLIAEKFAQKTTSYLDTRHLFGNGPENPPTAVVLGPKYLASSYYRLYPAEDLELATLLVRPFPLYGNANEDAAVVTKENYGSVTRVYIVCDQENDDVQRWMIEKNPPDEVMEIPGSDHMAMLSKPNEMYSCLQEIGTKYL